MEKRTVQIQDLRGRQGEYTLVTSKAKEVGSAAFIEEIWGSNLGFLKHVLQDVVKIYEKIHQNPKFTNMRIDS